MELTITHVGAIDDSFVRSIQELIVTAGDVSALTLNISSSGGSVVSGITAYNFLKQLPYPITCHNLGEVSSAAILPYLAGEIRTAEKVSKFMFHPIEISFSASLPFFKVEEMLSVIGQDIENYAAIVTQEVPRLTDQYDIAELLKHQSLILSPLDAHSVGVVTEI